MATTREVCKRCHRHSPVGFDVPDSVWDAVSQGQFNVLCIVCFDELATDLGIDWSEGAVLHGPITGVDYQRSEAAYEAADRSYRRWERQEQAMKAGRWTTAVPVPFGERLTWFPEPTHD